MTVLYNPHAPADAHLIAKYDGRAPRYTSYPTAVQFTADVDEATYRGWLAALPPGDPVSVYMHIPFCTRLCWYCGCNTRAVTRREPIGDYVGLLMRELSILSQALPGRLAVGDIHLGGGSPNMLSVDELDIIFTGLRQTFAVAPDAEIAAELDPAVLSGEWIAAAARHGLSRASLGVQNLAPEVQKAVNRQERFEEIADCVEALRAAGVGSINLDLMYGLPHQTTRNTLTTLDAVLTLRPERLALFGYAHVPWMKAHQQLIEEAALPGPAERLEQSQAAAERLKAEGYVQIGLDHFALPDDTLAKAATHGGLHRNFQGYTTDLAGTLLGLGASAIGTTPGGYVQNITAELGWRHAVADGKLPIARGVAVTEEDRFRADIIERLMCDFAVDLAAACERHGRDLAELEDAIDRLHDFRQDGLAAWDGQVLTVTPRGRMLVRSICALFDAYLAPDAQRHAKAI
ncbi:MAG: oxygen-independent coproporphyrinogen III oxidase [Phenylobacterium sp.]|uniref:oxygen-independent coproporphyrinogen III oxidase n=1 Tax=Phenylobacterium sp. TaxID=1871053 RepID=UPI002721EF9F|nr:oxygen-independent coproporphyrinogen III oxidase [Phenylobacterium sp.]MDO8411864.1 oxygen-independent coproporphyrinogen III oxidase [Phenylobacterium sp.]